MSRKLLIPLVAAAFLAAPAFAPAAMTGLSDSAMAGSAKSKRPTGKYQTLSNSSRLGRGKSRMRDGGGKPKAPDPTGNFMPGGY